MNSSKMITMVSQIASKKALFFDFDGVIKESVEVKSDAFEQLFLVFGIPVARRVRLHHEANGGMSRFDKLPIYLAWAGVTPSSDIIKSYSDQFSSLVKQNVIDSDWVPGVVEYLINHAGEQLLFLVTATPEDEIKEIAEILGIDQVFCEIIGAPTTKKDALHILIKDYQISPKQAAMIGDSISDYQAAEENEVPFILRRTNLNIILQDQLKFQMIDDFIYE